MTYFRCCNTTSSGAGGKRRLARAAAALLLFVAAAAAIADDRQQAEQIIQRALAASRSANVNAAYQLKIQFRVPGRFGTEGTMQFWWISKDEWRREIHARGFNETVVAEPDRHWVASDLPYTPDPISMLEQMAGYGTTVDWPLNHATVKIKHERGSNCIQAKTSKRYTRMACFDEKTGVLTSVSDTAGTGFEFLNYGSFDGRLLPRQMNAYEGDTVAAQATLQSFSLMPKPDEALLKPPADAEAWDWCDNMVPPNVIRQVAPKFPGGVPPGDVRFWIVVGTDGHVEQGGLMQSGGGALDRAAAEAMKQWLFRPALCNGLPVRYKTTATFNFGY